MRMSPKITRSTFLVLCMTPSLALAQATTSPSSSAPALEEITPPDAGDPPTPASTAVTPPQTGSPTAVVDRVTHSADTPPVEESTNPLAGYQGAFFLRDKDDNFRLYIQGRAQIDSYNYFGPGVSDTSLKSTLLLRRIRPELTGEFLKHWQWILAGDWGQTGLDNPKGTNEASAAAPGKAPTAASGRYAPPQTATLRAAPTDVFVNYHALRSFNVQVGQFDAPFTMENRTSDKYIPFMERSLAVRALGIPSNKEMGAMFWGETDDQFFFYSLGFFNGDGQNRVSPDNRMDSMARAFVHPLVHSVAAPLRDLQFGASVRYGARDQNYVYYDAPAMTTQGGWAFWNPSYGGSKGQTHVLPAGVQEGVAGELRAPISMVDLTSEFVYIKNRTREAVEGFQTTNTERFGELHGYSYYIQLGLWLLGNRDVNNGLPGYENPTHIDFKNKLPETPPQAIQLLVKWEQLRVNYAGASRSGTPDSKNIDGDIKVDALSLGANYWATRHVRLTANYVLSMFPDSEPVKASYAGGSAQTSSQRAIAPTNTLPTGVNDTARESAHQLHELLFRVAVAF